MGQKFDIKNGTEPISLFMLSKNKKNDNLIAEIFFHVNFKKTSPHDAIEKFKKVQDLRLNSVVERFSLTPKVPGSTTTFTYPFSFSSLSFVNAAFDEGRLEATVSSNKESKHILIEWSVNFYSEKRAQVFWNSLIERFKYISTDFSIGKVDFMEGKSAFFTLTSANNWGITKASFHMFQPVGTKIFKIEFIPDVDPNDFPN